MERLFTAQQVSILLNLHVQTLYKKLRDNEIKLPYVQVTQRTIGFRPDDVEAYVRSRVVELNGNGRRKNVKTPSGKRIRRGKYRFMTDEETQAFFANVERDQDGVMLCSPTDD